MALFNSVKVIYFIKLQYIIKKFYMSQMNPKIFLHNNTFSEFNHRTLPVTPFNGAENFCVGYL